MSSPAATSTSPESDWLQTELLRILSRMDLPAKEPGIYSLWTLLRIFCIAKGSMPGNKEWCTAVLQNLAVAFLELSAKPYGKKPPKKNRRGLVFPIAIEADLRRRFQDLTPLIAPLWPSLPTLLHGMALFSNDTDPDAAHERVIVYFHEALFIAMLTRPGQYSARVLKRLALEVLASMAKRFRVDVRDLAQDVVTSMSLRQRVAPAYVPHARTIEEAALNARKYASQAIRRFALDSTLIQPHHAHVEQRYSTYVDYDNPEEYRAMEAVIGGAAYSPRQLRRLRSAGVIDTFCLDASKAAALRDERERSMRHEHPGGVSLRKLARDWERSYSTLLLAARRAELQYGFQLVLRGGTAVVTEEQAALIERSLGPKRARRSQAPM